MTGKRSLADDVFEFVKVAARKLDEMTAPEVPAEPAAEDRPVDAGLARETIGDARLTLARLLRKEDVVYLPLLNTTSGWVTVDIDPALSHNDPRNVVVTGTVLDQFDGHVHRTWTLALNTIVIIRPRKKTA